MATQRTQTPTPFEPGWTSLSGLVLAGGFELQEMVEADAAHARYKVRVLGDRDLECTAECYRLAPNESAAQVEVWEVARQLRHPNLAAPMGAGLAPLDGEQVAYAIVRRADESLSGVLVERALTPEETGEALRSVAKGLEALHVNGLVHGCLSPAQILAVGDEIKLDAACVRAQGVEPGVRTPVSSYLAPESRGENLSTESDVWCLGATVFEALTQKRWTEGARDETGALPEPFRSIALRCLEQDPAGRASLGEVMALYRGELKPVPRVRAAAAGASGPALMPEALIAPAGAATEATVFGGHGEQAPGATSPGGSAAVSPGLAGQARSAVPPPTTREAIPPVPVAPKPQAEGIKTTVLLPPAAPAAGTAPSVATGPPVADVRANPSPKLGAAEDQTKQKEAGRPALVSRPLWEDVVGGTAGTEEKGERPSHLWIWAAVALLIVLGLVWALRPKTHTVARATQSAAQPASPPAPAAKPGGEVWETRTLQPDGSASRAPASATPANSSPHTPTGTAAIAPGKSERKAAATNSPVAKSEANRVPAVEHTGGATGGAQVWRVVLYTYSRQEDAQRKADDINASKRGLRAEVFSPSGSGTPFLVTTAGHPSKEEAAQLRRKAIASGMPRDTYIQNYSR